VHETDGSRASWLDTAANVEHAHLMAKLKGASIARLAMLAIALGLLVWALLVPASECVYPSADYGICSDNSALKWQLAIFGAVLIGAALVSYAVARRRHVSSAV
jgi:hypothetical protein